MSKKIRLALLISGGGTTAQAIINACFSGRLQIDPVLVIASKNGIKGISRVQEAGITTNQIVIINPKAYKNSRVFGEKLIDVCKSFQVDIVGQYGWMPLTPVQFIRAYEGKIINQHPGPLDNGRADFGGKGMYGRRVHCAVLYFRRMTNHDFWTEATTHFVTDQFDKGQVIQHKKVDIRPDDAVEDLQQRVLPIEHEVQIEVLNDFVLGKVKVVKRSTLLVKDNELKILEEAKKIASMLYPKG
jgi:phosphoribosylglycinamide formyltransferase 1